MDDLIAKYAKICREAKVGDYTFEGILASFAREIAELEAKVVLPAHGPGTNTGHGHVWARLDGFKARCGGPSRCQDCAKDWIDYGYGLRDSS